MILLRKLVALTLVLAFIVILKGAYTRLVDAGLGCPDWPGCYGYVLPPEQSSDKAQAAADLYPERPPENAKMWPEMIHRYLASSLGLLILAIAFLAWKNRHQQVPYKLALLLVPLVIFQGLLGKWTVTMGLFPPIVMGHLLGGFLIISILSVLYYRLSRRSVPQNTDSGKIKKVAIAAFAMIFIQIALGGWTSANYAALVCTDLPICEPGWQDHLDFDAAFSVGDIETENYEFGVLPAKARLTIHVMHRFGAILSIVLLFLLIAALFKSESYRHLAWMLTGLLLVQVSLGVSNVLFNLPLPVAVAHNGVAALLLALLMITVYVMFQNNKNGLSDGKSTL